MREYSVHAALERHPDLNEPTVSIAELAAHFDTGRSTTELLRRMGPFVPAHDAFRFGNNFAINAEQANDFLEVLSDDVMTGIVSRRVGWYLDRLTGLDLNPIPYLETRIPDFILDLFAGRLQRELMARLIDLVADPVGSDFGRCGGMAFAGYDFYRARIPIPATVTVEPAEGPLGQYIYDRLLDSLRLNVSTFADWVIDMQLQGPLNELANAVLLDEAADLTGPIADAIGIILGEPDLFDFLAGEELLLANTRRQWTDLKEILDREAAWPIGLIYGDRPLLWDQHQVLAIAYSDNGASGGQTLSLWDNNYRNTQDDLTLDFSGDELVVSGGHSRHAHVKGFFAEQYFPERPPASVIG
jgi:hypothetical protein